MFERWYFFKIMGTPLPAAGLGVAAAVIGASAADLQFCCWLWSQGDAQLAACRWGTGWFGTVGPWRTHYTCTVTKGEKYHDLAHIQMQHYISSKEMEVVVFWTKNLNTDTEDNHIVGNLGSISAQRKWKLHFSGLRIWKQTLKIIIWLGKHI